MPEGWDGEEGDEEEPGLPDEQDEDRQMPMLW